MFDWELTFLYWRAMLPRLYKAFAKATAITELENSNGPE